MIESSRYIKLFITIAIIFTYLDNKSITILCTFYYKLNDHYVLLYKHFFEYIEYISIILNFYKY